MRFKSLTVAGAIPFPEQINIDFPGLRKIALVGDNGAGKSTVFDCIYAAFFGDVTKPNGLYSLFKNSKDGLIDLTFEMAGTEYRIRRLIDGIGRKQKPYFYMNGQPVTEGKVAEFEARVQETLGFSEKAFLASIYNCQTQKGNPLALNDRERRDLLTEVLGLSQFEEPLRVVVEELARLERQILSLRDQHKFLSEGLQDPAVLEEQKKRIADRLVFLDGEIKAREEKAQAARQELANAQANAQQLGEVNRQIQVLDEQIGTDNRAVADLEAKVQKNRSELLDKADEIRAAVDDIATHEAAIAELNGKLPDLETLLNEAKKAFAAERKVIGDKIADAEGKLSNAFSIFSLANTSRAKLANTLEVRQENIKKYKPQTALLDEVPCVGTEMHSTCKLLESARLTRSDIESMEKSLPDLQKQIAEMDVELKKLSDEYDQQKAEVESIKKEAFAPTEEPGALHQHAISEIHKQIRTRSEYIQSLSALAKNEPYLKDAEERIAGYQQEISVIRLRLDSNTVALGEWRKKAEAAKNMQETINRVQLEVSDAESERATLIQEKDQIAPQIGQLDLQIQQAKEAQNKLAEIDSELGCIYKRTSLLELLKEGLGPKGARALKIDSAGPEISELVNALLRECYGQKFTILIKTLRDLQSGEQREKLEFSIIDNETGEETPVENKSGGEQQLIKEVIAIGLCIYMGRRVGLPIRTIIRDESCSALTEENTERYVRMLDKACQIGGFDQVLYVSHKSCAQQMADAVIAIEGGKAKVIQG